MTINSDVNALANEPTVYRVTYNGTGIYEAYKKLVGKEEWLSFLQNKNTNWLLKPPHYDNASKSYFTQKGFDLFKKHTLPLLLEKLNKKQVAIFAFKVAYSDDCQVVISVDNGRFCGLFNEAETTMWTTLPDGVPHLPQDKSVYMDWCEVIGNIHDNPELVEVSE